MKTHRPLILAAAPVLALLLAVSSCATHMEIALQWKPTTSPAELQARMPKVDLAGAKVQFAKLEDTRENPAQIGGKPDPKQPKTVTTKDDVGAFVTRQLAETIALLTPGSGLQITDRDPAVIVSGKILEFYVTENRNYEAVVRLNLLIKKADGTLLREINTVGTSSRLSIIGFKAENYMEGYSDALLQVAKSLVEDAGFRKALKGE